MRDEIDFSTGPRSRRECDTPTVTLYPLPMPALRYHLPLGPRRSPETWRIMNRQGEFLRDASRIPFSWTSRNKFALSFRTKADAEAFVVRRFGRIAARELLGLRVVP